MQYVSSVKSIAFSILIVLGLTRCAPTITTYQLSPASGDIATIDGRQVTKAEQNGVGIVASFEREELDFVALDIEIKNYTNQSIEVNPADFRFTALNASQNPLTDPINPNVTLTRAAADPSYEAERMGLKRKQEERRLKRAKIFNTVLLVAAIASDASSSSNSRSYREYVGKQMTHQAIYQGIAIKRQVDRNTFANRMQQYDYEDYRWRELALKANTLAPGDAIRGFVYLPKVPNANYLAITYSLPEQTSVPLLFKQEYVQQKKQRRQR